VRADAEARRLWLEFVRANRASPDPDCAKPSITAQPSASGTLRVSASGAQPLSYDWFEGESGVTTTPVAVPVAGRRYWVRVSNRCGSALSAAVTAGPGGTMRRRAARH
jgi:hypothetical protein